MNDIEKDLERLEKQLFSGESNMPKTFEEINVDLKVLERETGRRKRNNNTTLTEAGDPRRLFENTKRVATQVRDTMDDLEGKVFKVGNIKIDKDHPYYKEVMALRDNLIDAEKEMRRGFGESLRQIISISAEAERMLER